MLCQVAQWLRRDLEIMDLGEALHQSWPERIRIGIGCQQHTVSPDLASIGAHCPFAAIWLQLIDCDAGVHGCPRRCRDAGKAAGVAHRIDGASALIQ